MVNQDDPEARIAELERRLAEQKHIAAPEHLVEGSAATPEDVRNAAFSKSVMGKPGYNEDEVDGYLARIEATLRNPAARGAITAADIRNVRFSKPPIGRRGYYADEVDAFLGRVEIELARRTGQQSAVDPGQDAPSDFGATTGPRRRHFGLSDDSWPQKILGHILAFRNETREGGGPWSLYCSACCWSRSRAFRRSTTFFS